MRKKINLVEGSVTQQTLDLAIKDEEWHFRTVSDDRVREAFVYEYCRSAEWITRAVKDCTNSFDDQPDRCILFDDLYVCKYNFDIEAARHGWGSGPPKAAGERADRGSARSRKKPVFEIRARRAPKPGPKNPFIYHDRVFTLSLGYPTRPYLSDPGAFAMVEIHEGMYLPGIYDLKSSIQRVNLEADSPIWHLADSKFRHMVTWMVSEPNGQPIELSRNDQSWRKFALAMDFSRPDEELQEDFKRFLNEARKNYSLPASKKSERLTRGRPLWLTTRFCQDALNALGAHRLVAAAQNDINDAFSFAKQRLAVLNAEGHADYHWSLDYSTKKELSRAAKKYRAAAARLFGSL